ncbi:MFS transporter [Dactylosporangium sp. NPDC049140]|uniref:MFS transporter n=1 Tax=Dactylosporangium sp. NPDC049140 TaxID=3155647 RepID=UPI0033E70A4A
MTAPTAAPTPAMAETPPPRRWLVLGLLGAGQFMLILDITVVNVALPHISADLHLGRIALTWALTAYTLCFGGLMLLGGRLADLLGARRTVLAGLAIFIAASALSGAAHTATTLIAGRALQGVGAAILSPAALSIVTTTFTGGARNKALGVWAALGGTGSAVGVLLGGALTAGPGWRWIFLINVPVGVAVLAALPLLTRAWPASRRRERLDLPGATLITAATGAAIYGFTTAGDDGWSGVRTLVPLAAAVVLTAGFLLLERGRRQPLLDPRLLTRRPMAAGAFLMLVATALLVGGLFLGSFWLQHVRGFTALATGLAFLPTAVMTIAGAHLGSRILGHAGGRAAAAGGLGVAAAGAAVATAWLSAPGLIIGLAVLAAGLGATFVAATSTALAHVDPQQAGVASGAVNTFHELGAAIGVAVVSSLAAAGLGADPTSTGFTRGLLFIVILGVIAAAVAAVLIPAGRPPVGAVRHMH